MDDHPDQSQSHPAQVTQDNQPVSTYLHPRIYEAIVGLALLYVVSAWACFATTGGYATYTVAVVTYFFIVVTAVPTLIWLSWRHQRPPSDATKRANAEQNMSFYDWATHAFSTSRDRLKGSEAAVLTLLPIAAVAFGMLAIGIVFSVVSGSMT
jgi:hypothetical protein